jgi:hypothetical protein
MKQEIKIIIEGSKRNLPELNNKDGKKRRESNRFYVYLHKDLKGNVFYVGKGTEDRAWRKDNRHQMWKRYVERINNEFKVEIYKDNLTEEEAEDLEVEVARKFGGKLINWVNPHRKGDWNAYEKYWRKRKENEILIEEAKKIEKRDMRKAVEIYKKSLNNMFKYDNPHSHLKMEYYEGLASEVYKEYLIGWATGNIYILDRLSICLKKMKKYEEINKLVEQYLKIFPGAEKLVGFKKILNRLKYNSKK